MRRLPGPRLAATAIALALFVGAPAATSAQPAGQDDVSGTVAASEDTFTRMAPDVDHPVDFERGGWDIYNDYRGGELTDYAGLIVIRGASMLHLRGTVIQANGDPALSHIAAFRAAPYLSGAGWNSWQITADTDSGPQRQWIGAHYLSDDVASMWVWDDLDKVAEGAFYAVRTDCDARFSETTTEEVPGCVWEPLIDDEWKAAVLDGDCQEGAPCYRLVSVAFDEHYRQQARPAQ